MGRLIASKSGEIASFKTPYATDIKSLKVHFSPKQMGSGDPSPENIREIVGWDGVEVSHSGKNMACIMGYSAQSMSHQDPSRMSLTNNYGTTINTTYFSLPDTKLIITQNQAPNISNKHHYQNGYFCVCIKNLVWGQKYNVSFKITDIVNNPLNADLSDIKLLVPSGSVNTPIINGDYVIFKNMVWRQYTVVPTRTCFDVRPCGMSFTLSEFMITSVEDEDFKYEPYKGNIVPVDWTDSLGTIYGGYVDLITGELVNQYNKIIIDGSQTITDGTTGIVVEGCKEFQITKNNLYNNILPNGNANVCTNYFKKQRDLWGFYINPTNYKFLMYVPNTYTASSLTQYFEENPLEFIYKKQETFWETYQLPSSQLQTLRALAGINNIWSNADSVEVSYELIDTPDIQKAKKRIILNQPHIETVSGDLVSFNTDMKAPLKECKVSFLPIQQGQGDPSPDNIRNITGWNNINLYQTGNKLIPNHTPSREKNGLVWTTNEDGSFHVEGTSTAATWYGKGGDPTYYIKGNVTYKLSGGTQNVALYLVGYNLDGTSWSEAKIGGADVGTGRIFTLDQDATVRYQAVVQKNTTVNETIYPKLVVIDTSNEYETYQGNTISLDWTDEAGTVYGGYIDLVKGELVAEWELAQGRWGDIKSSTSDSTTGYYQGRLYYNNAIQVCHSSSDYSKNTICNVINKVWWEMGNKTPEHYFSGNDNNKGKVYIFGNYDDDVIVQIAVRLAEPIHYSLTPQQILTLKQTNNIYANTNGNIEVKYWKH